MPAVPRKPVPDEPPQPPLVEAALSAPPSSLTLTPRATSAGLGGALATIAVVALQQLGIDVTAELAAAVATATSLIAAWLPRA